MLYKRELIHSFETIGYSCCIMMSMIIGPKWSFYSCCDYIGLLGTGFMQVLYLGGAPHTKETLPYFLKWHRVTRHPLVFRGLTGSQRTPGYGASHTMFWDGKIPSKMANGSVPKFPHTLVNQSRQLWTPITFSSELRFARSWTLRKAC